MRFIKRFASHLALALVLGAGLACSIWSTSDRALAQSDPISIFFDFGRSDVTKEAKRTVAVVKDVLRPGVRLTITGYCDTAEANPAKLSMARALAVAKTFVDIGVPAGAQITILAKGATELRQQTGPNVKEAVNRYAAITVSY